MSRHWTPDGEGAGTACELPDGFALPKRRAWPPGAIAGVALIGVACLGAGVLLYKIAGPRSVVDASVIE